MQQFETSAFNMVVHWHKLGEVENECNLTSLSPLPSLCQKFPQLVEIWQSYNKNNFAVFLDTVYTEITEKIENICCTTEYYGTRMY